MMSALLVLEDGTEFYGLSIGSTGIAVGEVVFNTSMTGYQEILTDPSYLRQIVTLTCPQIGNVGVNLLDEESDRVYVQGLVIRDLSLLVSNYRSEETLSDYLKRHNIVAIADVDTRKLTRILSEKGTQKGCIVASGILDPQLALKKIRAFSGLKGLDLAKTVSVKTPYDSVEGTREWNSSALSVKKQNGDAFHVVAYDYGIKRNMLRMLVDRGCRLTVVPAETSVQATLLLKPDGVLLSNGPGDPEACEYAINAIKGLLEAEIPLFGICLGHQLLALASGAKTTKMKFGHHGANHPVKDLETGLVMISAQNHSFSVDESSLTSCLRATHRSLFDGSLQGIRRTDKSAFSFQGHPEASPGPHDMAPLFDRFIDLMQRHHAKRSLSSHRHL